MHILVMHIDFCGRFNALENVIKIMVASLPCIPLYIFDSANILAYIYVLVYILHDICMHCLVLYKLHAVRSLKDI